MNGPEHYRAAERHLGWAKSSDTDPAAQTHAAFAQVHATLALAAATAQGALAGSTPDGLKGMSQHDVDAWNEVAGVKTVDSPKAAELTALRKRITAIHREADGIPHSEGSCIADGQDWPCATIRALNAEAGEPRG